MTESMIDVLTENPELIPDGWELRADELLASPSGVLLVDFSGDLFRGTYLVARSIVGDGFATRELVAEVRTDDPRVAVAMAVAADRMEP